MYSLLNLRKTVGPSYNVDPEDVLTLKKALNKTGHYKMPDFGLTPYPDTPLMKGIKSFQKDTGLKQDSTVKPGGPTEKMLGGLLSSNGLAQPHQKPRQPQSWETPPIFPQDNRPVRDTGLLGLTAKMAAKKKEQQTKQNQPGEQKVVMAPAAVPAIVQQVAQVLGMSIAAAWAWWQTLSEQQKKSVAQQMRREGDENEAKNEKRCDDLLYKTDVPTCNGISKRRGKEAGQRCFASAHRRNAACLRGTPTDELPPLDTWNN